MNSSNPPLYIAGRQHCGNTMLATLLGRQSEMYAFTGEGTFFEHLSTLRTHDAPRARIVEHIAEGADPPLDAELRDRLTRYLQREETAGSAAELYKAGKAFVARTEGADRWVQKATSYIFHVDSIFDVCPDARIVFLIRNPLDLAASLKRRGEWRRIMRMVWGWNRGLRAAQSWATDSRMRTVRYEDVVRRPETTLREVCDFADLPFEDALLDVSHVNRSETPYNQGGEKKGLDASRIHYYREVLTPAEEATVRAWIDSDRLESTYPDLPAPRRSRALRRYGVTALALGRTVRTLMTDHARLFLRDPRQVFERIRRRIS